MGKKINKEEDLNIRITKSLKEQYKRYCLESGIDMSKHIRDFIETAIKSKQV